MRGSGAAIVLGLMLYAEPAVAQSLPPGVSPEEAHAGCIHKDLRPCMITLGAALYFDMNLAAKQIALRNELDVNGKTAHRTIVIDASAPGHHEPIGIILTLASPVPNDTVVKAEIWLPVDPDTAHTQSDYDKTYLYDVVAPLLGQNCPGLDRLGLYRFYENSLKPREIVKTELFKRGIFTHTVKTVDTEKVAFCGVMFSVHKRGEWDGPPENPASRSLKFDNYIQLE
jgi:hypothetical protein